MMRITGWELFRVPRERVLGWTRLSMSGVPILSQTARQGWGNLFFLLALWIVASG